MTNAVLRSRRDRDYLGRRSILLCRRHLAPPKYPVRIRSVAHTCGDTFSLVSLVSAGLGIGLAPEWTLDLPNRNVELRKVRGVDIRIGLGVAWFDDPTAARDDIIDIARSLVRVGR